MMCSTEKGSGEYLAWQRQYSQQPEARWATACFCDEFNEGLAMDNGLDA